MERHAVKIRRQQGKKMKTKSAACKVKLFKEFNWKRPILAWIGLLSAIIALSTSSVAISSFPHRARVKIKNVQGNGLRVRKENNIYAQVIDSLRHDTTVEILDREDGWLKISYITNLVDSNYDGEYDTAYTQTGWVNAAYVCDHSPGLAPCEPNELPEPGTTGWITFTDFDPRAIVQLEHPEVRGNCLNVYRQPDPESRESCSLKHDTPVQVVSRYYDWYKVRYKTGVSQNPQAVRVSESWVSSIYICDRPSCNSTPSTVARNGATGLY
ncbi:MAG: hypothetical protein Fur006_10280 [Coleofasciculaceae cyanobacterium]